MLERIGGVSPATFARRAGVIAGWLPCGTVASTLLLLPVGTTLPRNPPKQDAVGQSARTSVPEAKQPVKWVKATTSDNRWQQISRVLTNGFYTTRVALQEGRHLVT